MAFGCEKVSLEEEKKADKENKTDDKKDEQGVVNDKSKSSAIYVTVAPFNLTRGEAYTPTADKIVYALFDSIGKRCWITEQTSGESKAFGTLNATVDAGTYRLLTIGHHTKGMETCTLDAVSFVDGIPFDTYSHVTEFTIESGWAKSFFITLDEITARVEVKFPNGKPKDLRSVSVTFDKGSVSYKPLTGFAIIDEAKRDYFASSMFTQENNFTVAAYRFLTATEETTKVDVAVMDINGEYIQSYSFDDVLLKRGETTRLELK